MKISLSALIGGSRATDIDALAQISTPQDWSALAARPGHHTVARTETVKFVIDLNDDKRTWFLNSKKWETHYEFVLRHVNPRADYKHFLIQEYTRDDRRFVLGSVMHYLDGGHWTVELAGGDTLGPQGIMAMFTHIKARLGIASDLRFRAVSPGQVKNAEALGERLPVLSSTAIHATLAYQPVVLGQAYGYLRLVRGTLDVASLRPYDVVVTESVPEEIPPVAALVTSDIQAPLAHVAVLSRNRNTPDMALRGAIDLEAFRCMEGQLVKLTVQAQDYRLELAERTQAEAAWSTMRPGQPLRPDRDLQPARMFDVHCLADDAARYVGAKAAQLGRLGAIECVRTPGGFAIPFAAYAKHLDAAGLTDEIEAMLADPRFCGDASIRAEQLARVRGVIRAHPVDADLLAMLANTLRGVSMRGRRLIFRSSTNAEDLDGFSGAGLYESTAVSADPTPEQIADALRAVWASVWLQRAFEEREWYRIDHRLVAMAVLVQPFVTDAVATGVAITGNPFKESLRAVFINSQTSGATVTGALGNELPEQFLVATWAGAYEPELLSRSSLTNGAAILEVADLHALTAQLLRIHEVMLPEHGGSNAMDVEFALTAQREFVIVQARPYKIVYSQDRAPRAAQPLTLVERLMYRVRRVVHRFVPAPKPRGCAGAEPACTPSII